MRVAAALVLLGTLSGCTAFGEAPLYKTTTTKRASTPPGDDDDSSASKSSTTASGDPVVDTTDLDPFFQTEMSTSKIPGLGLEVIGDGHLKWTKGYGVMDRTTQEPVGRDTLFMLGGISTTIVTIALMQLIEDPKNGITLDSDISQTVGFQVRNPSFPNTPVTYKMLLSESSGLNETGDSQLSKGDSSTPLVTYVKDKLAASDAWKNKNPGEVSGYSDLNIDLVGVAIEAISGENLQTYVRGHIFAPLGMSEASFFLRDLDPTHVAQAYDGASLTPKGLYGFPDYPSGQLRTSAPQMARFLMLFAQKGKWQDQRLFAESSYDAVVAVQNRTLDPSEGLIFYHSWRGGKAVVGMDGFDYGLKSEMFVDPDTQRGYVLVMNSNDSIDHDAFQASVDRMTDKLMGLSETLP
jgi:CubicO group peptidase (beta-lactamase class C family)